MKKITRLAAVWGGALMCLGGISTTSAFAIAFAGTPPASLAGATIAAKVTAGSGSLATNGYYMLIATNSGSTYELLGVGGVANSGGTFSYSVNNSIGVLAFNDSIAGPGTNDLEFITATNGDFDINALVGTQSGTFQLLNGAAPITIANHSYFITIGDGAIPFGSSGKVIFTANADGWTYSVNPQSQGLESTTGTYTYSRTNNSTGYFCLEDSLSGNSTEYFAYTATNSGVYLVQGGSGGYQVGSFTVSNLIPSMFFMGQTDVTTDIDFLTFTNGTTFGYYNVMDFTFPMFYHYDMGFEYYFDANNSDHGAYLYDFSSKSFFYTSPSVFPYLYDFKLNAWLYYFPDQNNPGHYTSNPRWFYNFSTSQFINK